MNEKELILKLKEEKNLSDSEFSLLLSSGDSPFLAGCADEVRREHYSDEVYIRGLIEFTNYCKNDCYYCGIRRSNKKADRYRLSEDEILSACETGHALGFRTFVLQGGEDLYFTDSVLCALIEKIKSRFPDSALTLSVGEREMESYRAFFASGADRFLLRHETADREHYSRLHPENLSLENRKRCLFDLKEIGFQVGSGFMVGSPYQTNETIISDLRFLKELDPDMIGIGPFIHHADTPLAAFPSGSVDLTLKLISVLRLMFPHALIPATTALGTLDPLGREKGLKAGANVVMPNLSPVSVRKKYALYENKICTGEEAAECKDCLAARVKSAGYRIVTDIGNVKR